MHRNEFILWVLGLLLGASLVGGVIYVDYRHTIRNDDTRLVCMQLHGDWVRQGSDYVCVGLQR